MEARTSIAAMDFFAELPDPRQAGKVVYPLKEIILVPKLQFQIEHPVGYSSLMA